MTKRGWTAVAIAILVLLVAIIFWRLSSDKRTPTVGAILPLTGEVATYGIPVKQGIDLALETVNAEGGVQGRPVAVIYEDDKGNPNDGVAAARKLISVDKVHVIIGAVPSSVTLAIAPIAEQSRVDLLSPASSSPKITNAGDYIFRNYPSDELEGKLVATFAFSHGYKSAALVTISNDYGNGLRGIFKQTYTGLGGTIPLDEIYSEGTQDFRTILSKIKSTNPDCVFIVGYGQELGTLVRQARELGMKQQFLSTVNFYDKQSLSTGGSAVEGVIFTSPVFDPESNNPTVKAFVDAYRKKYSKDPDVWSAHGYDALLLVVKAMREKGLSSDDIKEGLYSIKDFPGVSGRTTFDSNGDVIKDARFLTVKNGQFAPYLSQ